MARGRRRVPRGKDQATCASTRFQASSVFDSIIVTEAILSCTLAVMSEHEVSASSGSCLGCSTMKVHAEGTKGHQLRASKVGSVDVDVTAVPMHALVRKKALVKGHYHANSFDKKQGYVAKDSASSYQ